MATKIPIDPGLIMRAAQGFRNTINSWFGPLEPLTPFVPGNEQASVEGRRFDFPVGFNRLTTPRGGEAVSFAQLRGLADSCDVLRIVIETRKDQVAKLSWKIKPKDDKKLADSRCDEIEDFLLSPDKEHDWDTWLRMLLEDLFVIDAPAVYIRKTIGGSLYALEPIDGATIKRVIDEQGRTPLPPNPAYQQVLKGIPAVNYTKEELLYRPRNVRTNKIYGYSPVEQIILTVNIALRRAVHKLQYYTEGNVPEAIIGTPENWNPDQIAQFQLMWDSLNEGNTAERRHAKFVPGKLDIRMTKEDVLKDAFDEWLARIVCFAFSIEPTAFVHQSNRATAESAREAALSEGLAPIMQWVASTINLIIWNVFGYKDLQFEWVDEEVQDPLEKAQVNQIYVNAGVLTPDEVRQDLGLEAFTPEQLAAMAAARAPAPTPLVPMLEDGSPAPDGGPQPPGQPPNTKGPTGAQGPAKQPPKPPTVNEKVNKAKKIVPGPIDRNRASVQKLQSKLQKIVGDFLAKQPKILAAKIGPKLGLTKADETAEDKARRILEGLDIEWDGLVSEVSVVLGAIVEDGAAAGLKEVGSEIPVAVDRATQWAQDRSAEMVGKKWVDGELVDNPDASWVITDSTREMIQSLTADAIDQGYTTDELAAQMEENFAFSPERAEMIARTETAQADSQGQMQGYEESGVVEGTEWTTAEDDEVDSDCVLNGEAGIVPLGEEYPSGDTAPPAHPNCRCAIIAALIDENSDSAKFEKLAVRDLVSRFMDALDVAADIAKGGPESGPHAGTHHEKPTSAKSATVKGKLHEVFASGHKFSLSELHAITGGTKESLQSALSNIKSAKTAGPHGPLDVTSHKDGTYSVVQGAGKPEATGDKPAAAEKPTAAPEPLSGGAKAALPPSTPMSKADADKHYADHICSGL
jgi:SPP1 gp7 family putative phage head morphogenesis protein